MGAKAVDKNIKARLEGKEMSAADAHRLKAQRGAVEKVFKMYDKDGTGKLELPEFMKLVETLGVQRSKEEVQQMFHEMDKNSDSEIDFEEVFSWYSGGQ